MKIEQRKERFVEEFVLNLKHQRYKLLEKHMKVFQEIWIDYLYSICPQIAVCMDPKIIDAARKIKNEKTNNNK